MYAVRPSGEVVRLAIDGAAAGGMAGKAYLSLGAIADEKISSYQISGLHVRVMTRSAFDITVDKLYSVRRICRGSRIGKRRDEIGRIFQGQGQTERM